MSGFIPAKPSSLRLAQCTSAGLGLPAPESWKVELAKEQEQMSFYPHGFALYEFSPEGGLYLGRRRVGMTHGRLYADVHDVWCTESPAGGWGISEIERGRYDGVKGAFEYTNVYWVALDTLWEIVREGKRLEPWVEGAVKQLSKVKADLVPQDVLGLFEFAVHGGDTPDSITLFPELGQDGEEQPDVIRDHSGHGNDLMVKPGTPQSVFETDEIFGSPTRCCECDAPVASLVPREASMYPAHFCTRCVGSPMPVTMTAYLRRTGSESGLQKVAECIRRLRVLHDREPSIQHVTLDQGLTSRYPVPEALLRRAVGLTFYGRSGDDDLWANVADYQKPEDQHPRAWFAAIGRYGSWLLTPKLSPLDVQKMAREPSSTGVAARTLIKQVGEERFGPLVREAELHLRRESEACAGCGKPSRGWLDDDETVRVCDECDDLIPPNKNGVVISADDAVGWVKRLRDPYARHTLWEQRVGVTCGAMVKEGLDPKGFAHAEEIWKRGHEAAARMTRALDEEQYARHQREFKPLRTDADVRKANERLRLLLSEDLVGRRLR